VVAGLSVVLGRVWPYPLRCLCPIASGLACLFSRRVNFIRGLTIYSGQKKNP
jgi:hypothetical protein